MTQIGAFKSTQIGDFMTQLGEYMMQIGKLMPKMVELMEIVLRQKRELMIQWWKWYHTYQYTFLVWGTGLIPR